MHRPGALETVAGSLLMAGLTLQLAYGLRSDGFTNDEILYISDGYRQSTLGDHRLNPTQPSLGQRIAAWGLVGLDLRLPEMHEGEDVLQWCYRFVHTENDASRLLARARLAGILLTLVLAVALWAWARSAGGAVAGLLALALVAFHPSILAHGHLATTDMPAALAMLLASWAFWLWSRAPSLSRALLVALFLAAGVATRLTAWLLLPSFVLLALLFPVRKRRGQDIAVSRVARHAPVLALLAITAVVVPLTIWISYDLRYAPWPGESALGTVRQLGPAGRVVELFRNGRLLPEGYLEAVRFQLEHNVIGHPAYLLGRHSKTGWWHYFLVAFLVKNTPGFLLAVATAVVVWWKRRMARLAEGSRPEQRGNGPGSAGVVPHCLVPAALTFVAISAGHIQIGERYLLPVYPYLILFAAVTLAPLVETLKGRVLLLVLLAFHVAPTVAVAPGGYLTYFNALAGGSEGGHRVLLDSNLDWGQDLPRLASWMRRQGVGEIQLAYHGVDDPDRLGIRHQDLPGWHLYVARPSHEPLHGTVAVSPNLLFGLMPRLGDPYAALRSRPPDDRAGVFFIYREKGESEVGSAR